MLWERLMLVGVALAYAIIAATLQPPYVFGALVARVPWLWPAVFATASVTSLAWALFPRLRLLAWASLLSCIAAAGSRSMALLFLVDDRMLVGWWDVSVGIPGAAGWGAVVALTMYAWPRIWMDLREAS